MGEFQSTDTTDQDGFSRIFFKDAQDYHISYGILCPPLYIWFCKKW